VRRNTGWAAVLITLLALSWLTPARAQTTDPHVHLVWAGTGNSGDPCHTGDQFMTADAGQVATATACVLSGDEAPVDTSSSDLYLSWNVTGTAVITTDPLPAESNQSGTASVEVNGPDQDSNQIEVRLCSDPSCSQILSTDLVNLWIVHGDPIECNDGMDNDGDGDTDYPEDADCSSLTDDTESHVDPGGSSAPRECDDFDNVIVGTAGADVLVGTDQADCVFGAGGNDIIIGKGGADVLIGGRGDDTVEGRRGNDRLQGNPGEDDMQGDRGTDLLRGGDGSDLLAGGRGDDRLFGGYDEDECSGAVRYRSCEIVR
jgi:Ca2+-binding RTX toxin-like protein